MEKDNIVYNSFRMNMNNPQHQKINQVLMHLDHSVYKSKNQFIADALEFFIDHYGKENFIEKDEITSPYVRREEFEQLRKELFENAMTEARKEVIRVLGSMVSGMSVANIGGQSMVKEIEDDTEEMQEDAFITGLAAGWMEG